MNFFYVSSSTVCFIYVSLKVLENSGCYSEAYNLGYRVRLSRPSLLSGGNVWNEGILRSEETYGQLP